MNLQEQIQANIQTEFNIQTDYLYLVRELKSGQVKYITPSEEQAEKQRKMYQHFADVDNFREQWIVTTYHGGDLGL